MRAPAALLVLLGLGAASAFAWASATRDRRAVARVRERLKAELATTLLRPPEPRPVLRGRALPGDARPGIERAFGQVLQDPTEAELTPIVADLRLAVAHEGMSAPRHLAGHLYKLVAITGALHQQAREASTPLEAATIALDCWRLQHDLERHRALSEVVGVAGADGDWMPEQLPLVLPRLTTAEVAQVARELETLLATHPRLDRALEASRIEWECEAVVPSRLTGPGDFVRALEEVAFVESAATVIRAAFERGGARAALDLATDRVARAPSGYETRLWIEWRHGVALWITDVASLRVLHVAALARLFVERAGRAPRSLAEALGRSPLEDELDPADDRPLDVTLAADGCALVQARSPTPGARISPWPSTRPRTRSR